MFRFVVILVISVFMVSCAEEPMPETTVEPLIEGQARPEIYAPFTLTADLSYLTDNQREMIGILIEAGENKDVIAFDGKRPADVAAEILGPSAPILARLA